MYYNHPEYHNAAAIVRKLRSLTVEGQEDRGTLAALRSYWSPTTRGRAVFATANLFEGNVDDAALLLTAATYGLHRIHQEIGTLGDTCRRIAGNDRDTFSTHLRHLLNCDVLKNDLEHDLQRIAKRAAQKKIPINYIQLYLDLYDFTRRPYRIDSIGVRWAKDFFSAPEIDPAAEQQEVEA